jgi:hypothetical protein
MAMVGTALTALAGIASLIFTIQILITAFKTSTGWGLASLLLPFAILVFVIKHWEATKTPFLRSLIAWVVMMVGVGISFYGAISAAGTPVQ